MVLEARDKLAREAVKEQEIDTGISTELGSKWIWSNKMVLEARNKLVLVREAVKEQEMETVIHYL
jgi:hypothetical protein